MNDSLPPDISEQLIKFAESGDEAGARNFLLDNLDKLSPETRDELAMILFDEALDAKFKRDSAAREIKEQGVQMIHELEQQRNELDDRLKLGEIKKSI